MKRLSLIIPVYNVEAYIGRCLDSCVKQDVDADEYEIIVVDDGSPDKSAKIVADYQHKYDNIKLVTRNNGGLSAARNTGLAAAVGEYIWFVDSDDWIESNCMGGLLNFAEDNSLDVLCFGAKLYTSSDAIAETPLATSRVGEVFSGEEFIVNTNPIPSAWSALYRRDFLIANHLEFYEGILHEDQEFTPRAYSSANRIAYLHTAVYYYYQRAGSIMKSTRNEKRCQDLLVVADSLYAFAESHFSNTSDAYKALIQKVNFAVSQSLAFYDKAYFPVEVYREKPYYPLSAQEADGFIKLKYILINTSLPLYLFLYRYLKK